MRKPSAIHSLQNRRSNEPPSTAFYNRKPDPSEPEPLPATILTSPAPQKAHPLDLIQGDMQQVDRVISERLTTEVPLVREVAQYIISAGGKRLRPALLLLISGALGNNHPDRFTLAAVVEFIHTATLLHDDVVDESTLRRGRSTANERLATHQACWLATFCTRAHSR